jgi:hypothetical protein
MDEARRFLRYVMPGLVYGVEVAVFASLVLPDVAAKAVAKASDENGLAVALGGLLASGGLGYIFASAHHFVHWRLPSDNNIINHTPNIRRLMDERIIPQQPVDRRAALDLTLEFWYQRLGSDKVIAAADDRIAALGDLAHAAGAARLASVAALATTLYICWLEGTLTSELEPVFRFILMLVLSSFCILLFHDSYARTGKIGQTLYDRVLSTRLEAERKVATGIQESSHNPGSQPDGTASAAPHG